MFYHGNACVVYRKYKEGNNIFGKLGAGRASIYQLQDLYLLHFLTLNQAQLYRHIQISK